MMMIDLRNLPENQTIETDVCIVGAGTAGMTLARELMDQNFQVCLLESGGLKPDRETQALYQGDNLGHPYFTLDSARARYFGGSTNRWRIPIGADHHGVRLRPLDAIDFEKRDWIPYSGWPFTKAHLDPFYERAQQICKITPPAFGVPFWQHTEKRAPFSLKGDRVETVIFKFGSRYPFVNEYAEEIRKAVNVTTYLYANVVEIETDQPAKTVSRFKIRSLAGSTAWVKAKHYVLAAGAIEIPRLLLSSNNTQRAGLGNQNNLVGRFFMEHPHCTSGVFVPNSPAIVEKTGLYDHIHRVNGVPVMGKLALSQAVLRKEKLLNFVTELSPRLVMRSQLNPFYYPKIDSKSTRSFMVLRSAISHGKLPADFKNHLVNILGGWGDFTAAVYRTIKKRALRLVDKRRIHLFRLVNMSEQAPNPDSRVILGSDLDSLGQRRAHLDWRLSTMDIDSIIRSQQILDEVFQDSGLGRVYIELNHKNSASRIGGGWHHMGTTRMHENPKNGVVDPNCLVHGMSNLFIAGPSVFPTSGYANPSLTIVALSVRLADHLKQLMS